MTDKEILEAYKTIIEANKTTIEALMEIIQAQTKTIMQFMGVDSAPPKQERRNHDQNSC